eukprot:TRINITY_DN3019_c0_g1_i1.p1 TRINITY_DN3019_c0_g1~~TRINITY_DN3019_c0_g1_i1.p1  ORF type:complete len:320 (-),score=70.28 TRINITY_DN3019_c0_g1_i1:24-878(-)
MATPPCAEVLPRILARYDLVLIMEIRDTTNSSIFQLLNLTNALVGNRLSIVLGPREGRTTSQEQYAFFYNTEVLAPLDWYVFDDGVEPNLDTFQREPMLVRWRALTDSENFEFVTGGIHVEPASADAEIAALVGVFDDAVARWNVPNIVIMGDFNADCSYLSQTALEANALYVDPRFHWLVPTGIDTTVGTGNCTYDRAIAIGPAWQERVSASSVSAYRFDELLSLNSTTAAIVSDHYPIEMLLSVTPSPPTPSDNIDAALALVPPGMIAYVFLSALAVLFVFV